jgi:hypothetical protein
MKKTNTKMEFVFSERSPDARPKDIQIFAKLPLAS